MRFLSTLLPLAIPLIALTGCTTAKTTNTARTATEQLLISNSVDQALAKVDFRPFSGRDVFLDEKYLDSVDKSYIAGSVRHQLLHAGSRLVTKAEEAEIVVEVRSGGVGTESKDMFLGIPAVSIPLPFPVSLPEVRLLSRNTQEGAAKIGLVAYDAKTRRAIGSGGLAMSKSDDNNWYFMGVGPFQNGSVRQEVARQTSQSGRGERIPSIVAFNDSPQFGDDRSNRVRVVSEERDDEYGLKKLRR